MDFDDIKDLINGLISDIGDFSKKDTKTIKKVIDSSDLKGVIDVTFDKEEKIPRKKIDHPVLVKDYKYWILKLDRYYKNPAMRINQLNIASLKMYASLCDSLEHFLNKQNTTIARLMSKLRREYCPYDIYYTLYKIAENKVLSFYNPLYDKSPLRSYEIIETYISSEAKLLIYNKSQALAKKLKDPDKDTRAYFNLTDNNMVSLWWDPSGKLREKYKISNDEQQAINQISKRNNVLRKNKEVSMLVLDLYIYSLRLLFDNKTINTDPMFRIMSPYTHSKSIFDSILIVTEGKVREKFSFFTQIKIDTHLKTLSKEDGGKLLDFLISTQDLYLSNLDDQKVASIYEDHLSEHPQKIKDIIKYIENSSLDKKISILEKYQDSDNLKAILDSYVKSESSVDRIIALYFAYKYNVATRAYKKVLFKIIKEENYQDFIDLVQGNDLDSNLIEEIDLLKNTKIKKIRVDNKKINLSRDKLRKTVNKVNEFYDDNDDNYEYDKREKDIVDDSNQAYNDIRYEEILALILDAGFISQEEVEEFAKKEGLTANTYLGKVNESLFDYVGDQALVWQDDKVVIDEFYVDMVKEYINGHRN